MKCPSDERLAWRLLLLLLLLISQVEASFSFWIRRFKQLSDTRTATRSIFMDASHTLVRHAPLTSCCCCCCRTAIKRTALDATTSDDNEPDSNGFLQHDSSDVDDDLLDETTIRDDDDDGNHQELLLSTTATTTTDFSSSSHELPLSKHKWKKKVYLLLKDISAQIQRKDSSAVRHAEHAVRRIERLYERLLLQQQQEQQESGNPNEEAVDTSASSSSMAAIEPLHLQAYNLWIHAIAKLYHPIQDRGPRAEKVLRQLQQQQTSRQQQRQAIQPNVVTYTSVMDAYAQQAKVDPKAPAHAERLLFEWIQQIETEQPPATSVFKSQQQQQQLHATSDGSNKSSSSKPVTTVTSVTCDTVLNAWAQQGTWKGAERAQEILDRLEALLPPNDNGDNMAAAPTTITSMIRPSVHSYATVVSGWANCRGGREAAEHAQALLDRMLYDPPGATLATQLVLKRKVRPDTVVFNAVLHAWATSRDPQAGSKAVAILKQMQELASKKNNQYDCRPDIVTYNTVLSCFSHSGHINAAARAEQVLKGMIEEHKANPMSAPAANTVSYNNVLHAWSKSKLEGASERAQRLLEFMIRSGDETIAPDVYSFTSVLDCLAKSKEPGKAVKARVLLDNLIELYNSTRKPSLLPTQVPFNAVLNAAAFSALGTSESEQRDAIQVAVQTFSLMRSQGVAPDMISYGNLLKALANLMPPGQYRTDTALQLFDRCCEDGFVGELVWNEARRVIPAKQLSEHIDLKGSIRSTQIRDLPREWRRNLRVAEGTSSVKKYKTKKTKKSKASPKRTAPVRRFRNISETSWQSGRDV